MGVTRDSAARPVRIGFDVDDTLIDHTGRLRAFCGDVFAELSGAGFELFIWSGVGLRWEIVDVHGLRPHVIGCYRKPISRHHERLAELGVPFVPDFVVDDDVDVVRAFGGYHISPPEHEFETDRHLLLARDAVLRRFPEFGRRALR